NFVHIMGMMFALHAVILAGCGWFWPRHGRAGTIDFRLADGEQLPAHLRPWRYAKLTSVLLVCLLISMYLTFSPLGFATVGGPGLPYGMLMGTLWLLFLAYAVRHLRCLARSPAPAIETV
ncbi:hypothetical protein EGI20_18495, partial [Aquitalea sp. S1-19]|nr:hypothetical protein [Aquitalea sp. S1-19]MCP9761209.1 hypothetical protein [Aquitalea sp. S1-19]